MRRRGVERAAGARVARGVVFEAGEGARIVLGPGAVLGPRCRLRAAAGATITVDGELGGACRLVAHEAVTVAAGARLGDSCAVVDFDHVTEDVERPIRHQGLRCAPVSIEPGALLGPGVAVLRGVTVGAGATVLPNSVVTRDVAPGAHVGGTPARVIDDTRSGGHAG